MTNQEARKRLEQWLKIGSDGMTDERLGYIEGWFHKSDKEAFNMAIKALESDRIEYGTDGNAYKLWISNGKEYEPSSDLISRQAVLDALEMSYLKSEIDDLTYQRIKKLPSVKQEPCEDAISRQAVIKAFPKWKFVSYEAYLSSVAEIEQLPPVKQERTGHCKDCKWWKDKDGVFRRGIDAESKCPINRIEVYEGNGYCFLYEPQEERDKE